MYNGKKSNKKSRKKVKKSRTNDHRCIDTIAVLISRCIDHSCIDRRCIDRRCIDRSPPNWLGMMGLTSCCPPHSLAHAHS